MTESKEIKIRKEFQKLYGNRIEQLEKIAATHLFPPFMGEPVMDWLMEVIHKETWDLNK